MRKAGGIIALIAGIFAVIAAVFTLMIGGAATAVEAKDAQTVVALGWGGVFFSFLTIVLGAVCMGATSRWPGLLLIICALAGIVLGGSFVALFMALALIGGVLALFGQKSATATVACAMIGLGTLALTPGVVLAQIKTLDVIDFLVDGQDFVGQRVTITGCKFSAASASSMLCSAGMAGNTIIDTKSLAREDLRRALRQCSGFTVPDECAGSVTGTITKNSFGLSVTKAALGWRPSS